MITAIPLFVALGLCLALLVPLVDRRADLVFTRIAMSVFGDYVAEDGPRKQRQRDLMRAAHVAGTHRAYASRTLLYSAVLGVAGSILGVYVAAAMFAVLNVSEPVVRVTLPASLSFLAEISQFESLRLPQLFLILTFASATLGSALSVGMYYGRWEVLNQRAHARSAEINATLPRTVAFMFALSRSGMAFPRVMDTLAENEGVYGEAATELSVAVRDMNAFGTDALTALQRTSRWTPSEDLADFSENLASVLGTGQSVSEFLDEQYERYQQEAKSKQEQYLDLLSTFAEAYVTALVAGPLLFITILVVIGLVLQDTLPLLRVTVYLGIPLSTFGFVVYVDSVTQGTGGTEQVDRSGSEDEESDMIRLTRGPNGASDGRGTDGENTPTGGVRSDGGVTSEAGNETGGDPWATSRGRLNAYDRVQRLRRWAASPVESMIETPRATFLVTVPLAVIGLLVFAFPITRGTPTRMIAQIEIQTVVATALIFAVYALVYEIRKRRLRRIESSVPDFLDRLASVNEAGTSVVGSVRRVADSNLEALTDDLKRTRRDIDWGADVSTALRRLERRIRSPMTARAVALMTNAMHASGDIAPVLRIAADESRSTWALRRERRQVMFTYLIVIYISFLVFLGIIASLSVSFIPAIESAAVPSGGGAGGVPGASSGPTGITQEIGEIDSFAYEQLFFHAATVQAICSGLVAGQLGEGSVNDGVKHVVILLAVTLLTFGLMGVV